MYVRHSSFLVTSLGKIGPRSQRQAEPGATSRRQFQMLAQLRCCSPKCGAVRTDATGGKRVTGDHSGLCQSLRVEEEHARRTDDDVIEVASATGKVVFVPPGAI